MATLSFTHTFVSGTLAKSSEVNQNFTDILLWSTNIQEDNFATFEGALVWNITAGVLAADITNAGSEGSISITQSTALAASKASIKAIHSGNDNASSLGAFYGQFTNASNARPIFQAQSSHAGPLFQATIDGSATLGYTIVKSGSTVAIRHSGTRGGLNFGGVTPIEWDASFGYFNSPMFFGVVKVQSDGGGNLLVDSPIRLTDSSGPRISKAATNRMLVQNELQLEDSNGPILTKGGTNILTTTARVDAAEVRAPIVRASSKLDFDDATKLYYEHTTSAPNYAGGVHRVIQKNYSTALVQTPVTARLSSDGLSAISGSGTLIARFNGSLYSVYWDLSSVNIGPSADVEISFSHNFSTQPMISLTLESDNATVAEFARIRVHTSSSSSTAIRLRNVSPSVTLTNAMAKRVHVIMFFQENGNS